MIITISGKPGSGKDTVGKNIAEKLGMKFYPMGDLRGELALKHGLTLDEMNKIGETEDWTDKEIDNKIADIGKSEDNFLMVSRTAFFLIPHSVKIFLDVELEEGAKRIIEDKGERKDEKRSKTVKDEIEKLKNRIESDKNRYKKYYNVDYLDEKNYDLWIDTTHISADHVADKIIKFIKTVMAAAVKRELEKENTHSES